MKGGSTVRWWTDEEIGFVEDQRDWTAPQIAAELGRTVGAVHRIRAKIRHGQVTLGQGWTADEDEYLQVTTHLSVEQVAAGLPGRSKWAVFKRRQYLAQSMGTVFASHADRWRPNIGGRQLIARTCSRCGLLLDAAQFRFVATRRQWQAACYKCVDVDKKPPKQIRDRRQEQKRNQARLQAITQDRATRNGYPWTDADDKVLADPDITVMEKALTLGRTYHAAHTACSRRGYSSKKGRGNETRGEWIIDNPNQPEVAA